MTRRRGVLRVLVALVVFAAAVGGSAALLWPRLPDPAVANREQLLRWLVTRDLGKESPETRAVLARRLEEEFGEGTDWRAAAAGLSDEQRQRAWENILLLLEPWFSEKVDGYYALGAGDRSAYLDRFLDTLTAWKGIEALRPAASSPPAGSANRGGLFSILMDRVAEWEAAADPPRREQIGQFLVALQVRGFWRGLTGRGSASQPSSGSAR